MPVANARKTLGSRAVGWVRVGGRRAAGAAQSFHFDVIFFNSIIIYIFIYILGVSAGAGHETCGGLGPALDPFGAPLDSVGIPKGSYGFQWIP